MQIGIISKLVLDRGYGTIMTKAGEEAHFHQGCLWDVELTQLVEGQGVEFEVQATHKGQLAFHIRPHCEE